jgi:hypothetical protein
MCVKQAQLKVNRVTDDAEAKVTGLNYASVDRPHWHLADSGTLNLQKFAMA